MKDVVWDLFKKTGKVQYFLLKQELERCEKDENNECERDLLKRDKLQ